MAATLYAIPPTSFDFSKPAPVYLRTDSEATLVDDQDHAGLVSGTKALSLKLQESEGKSFQRVLGDSELSYYLPSRESGVNDMYLHLGFKATPKLVERSRVAMVWAILRVRHPLLASRIEMHAYDDVRFVYDSPVSPGQALSRAEDSLDYRTQTKDELLDSYLNGPRTLSDSRLSYLILSLPSEESAESISTEVHLMICATHFLGDGMALHAFANDFFTLLTSEKSVVELTSQLGEEWESRCSGVTDESAVIPGSMESKLPLQTASKLRQAAAKVDFQCSQEQFIGGQSFPRRRAGPRKTIVPTVSFDEVKTKQMLKNCKAHGVSISAALFAICDIAWARLRKGSPELPTMMYSALNMRPYLAPSLPTLQDESYWFLAVGYFNVILPTFLPADERGTFWLRARAAKEQSTKAAKHRFLVDRAREMSLLRGERARRWGKEDDDKAAGIVAPPAPAPSAAKPTPSRAPAPSTALMGLSLLGNLDGTYKHANYAGMELHTLTTGSRQRAGGMLLFGYTFKGKLWVSLGYDENAFEEETVGAWWKGLLGGVEEFLERDS
ncbi:hypothetical protein BDV98DRAFT_570723 [Pterulicium gracile]|uniref:Alcohol acetyltransferase n=1 Tax=Pterulicium gracile TaxID=1884261 RepID=A0A5C3QCE4_9AGAR|nr:hypothetical protein BDV98DRAFT_570723 [Pterula gracilis]